MCVAFAVERERGRLVEHVTFSSGETCVAFAVERERGHLVEHVTFSSGDMCVAFAVERERGYLCERTRASASLFRSNRSVHARPTKKGVSQTREKGRKSGPNDVFLALERLRVYYLRVRNLFKSAVVVAVIAGCTRTVVLYQSCTGIDISCACSNGIHGTEACEGGKSTGQCICVAPVTPSITIDGAPAALSSSMSYAARVNAVDGLRYSWSISGGQLTSSFTGPSITFTSGATGVLLLNVNVSNSGGDTAAPAVLAVNVVSPPAALSDDQVLLPSTLTEKRSGIPLRIKDPVPDLHYVWSVAGGGTIDAQGAPGRMMTPAAGTMTVSVHAENAVGAQSAPIVRTVTVAPVGIELVAGVLGGAGVLDGVGDGARINEAQLVADANGTLFIAGDQAIRRLDASGALTTIAGVATLTGLSAGTGSAALFTDPIIAYTNGSLIVAQNLSNKDTGCPLELLTQLGANQAVAAPLSTTVANCTAGGHAISALAVDASGHGFYVDEVAFDSGTPGDYSVELVSFSVDGKDAAKRIYPTAADITANSGDDPLYDPANLVANADGTVLYFFDHSKINLLTYAASKWSLSFGTKPAPCDTLSSLAVDGAGTVYLSCAGSIWAGNALAKNFVRLDGDIADGTAQGGDVDSVNDGYPGTFYSINSITVGGSTLYVADGDTLRSTPLTGTSKGSVTTLAGLNPHSGGASNSPQRFSNLRSVVVNPDESLEVLESAVDDQGSNFHLDTCDFRHIDAAGEESVLAGKLCSLSKNGPQKVALFARPYAAARAPDGTVYFSDEYFDGPIEAVRAMTPTGLVVTAAGGALSAPPAAQTDGFVASAQFTRPGSIAVGQDGTVAVLDDFSGVSTLRLVTDGQVITVAGDPGCSYPFYGLDENCFLGRTVAIDPTGKIYVSGEAGVPQVAKVLFTLEAPDYLPQLVTVTPSGCRAQAVEPCATACLRNIEAMAVHPVTGELYFTDAELVRRMTTEGDGVCRVKIVAGAYGEIGLRPGPLSTARMNYLKGLAFSPSTLDLYASDEEENAVVRIRY